MWMDEDDDGRIMIIRPNINAEFYLRTMVDEITEAPVQDNSKRFVIKAGIMTRKYFDSNDAA